MKKRLLVLGLTALLTACSGGDAMKEITKDEFEEQAYAGQEAYMEDTNEREIYRQVVVRGSLTNIEQGKEDEVINLNVTYTPNEGNWAPDTEDEEITAYSDAYIFYSGSMFTYTFEWMEVTENTLVYTAGKDKWAVKGSYTASIDLSYIVSTGTTTVDYKFYNKYGYATSLVSESTQSMTVAGVARNVTTKMNISISYR